MTLEANAFNPCRKTGIFFKGLSFLLIGLAFISCTGEKLFDIRGEAQGTYYAIKYIANDELLTKEDFDALFAKIDSSLSTYKEYSVISQFNREDSMITADPFFIEMIRESDQIYHKSNGAFDASVLPLVRAWGFGPEGNEYVSPIPIDSLLKRVGWEKLTIRYMPDGRLFIKKGVKGMQLDFNAIAQGYSSDIIAEILDKAGINNYLVDSGGELKAKGLNIKGEAWKIGIDRPEENAEERQLIATFELNDRSVATSGNYRKFYVKDGVKYSHTISPYTGAPVKHTLLSATVITDSCSIADGFATALMVIGTEQAISLIESLDHVEAYLIYSDEEGNYKSYLSKGVAGMINENK